MLVNARSFTVNITALIVVFLIVGLAPASPMVASGLLQSNLDSPEIAEPECSFWLDHDNDGEGDEPFDADSESLVLQDSPVVGGCSFKLNTSAEATLLVASELMDWEVDVEIKREPGPTEDFKMYLGRTEIPGVKGSMRVIANFARGNTPRSGKSRSLPDGYGYEAQIPEEFRLLEITVTTPDGSKDRLERNARSASGAYIGAQRLVSDGDAELPEWAVTLAKEWLEDGYPQVAKSIMATDSASAASAGSRTNWWKWIAIVTWVGVVVVGVVAVTLIVVNARREPTPPPRNPDAPF